MAGEPLGQRKDVNGLPKEPVLYEAMYIVDAALEESAVEGIVTLLEEHVRANGGEVIATREFGRRRLAYEIEGHTSGTYKILYFQSHGNVVDEVTHEMHLTDGIVRGLVVLANPKAIFEPQAPAEPEAADEAATEEPDMALAEATAEGVSTGEAVAESEGEAEAEAEAEVDAEAEAEAEAEAGDEAEAEAEVEAEAQPEAEAETEETEAVAEAVGEAEEAGEGEAEQAEEPTAKEA